MTNGVVTVLGCGPAGLLTALAVEHAGYTPAIYSKKQPSFIAGAQFVHHAIPDLCDENPDAVINISKFGTEEGYAQKVYGNSAAPTSWPDYGGEQKIWYMLRIYEELWKRYEGDIVDTELRPGEVDRLMDRGLLVFNTVPLRALCRRPDEHMFESQSVWIDIKTDMHPAGAFPEGIVYDGTEKVKWYRGSYLNGQYSREYPKDPHLRKCIQIHKPLRNSCDCHTQMVRLGRYGRWEKKPLVVDAYAGALRALGGQAPWERF